MLALEYLTIFAIVATINGNTMQRTDTYNLALGCWVATQNLAYCSVGICSVGVATKDDVVACSELSPICDFYYWLLNFRLLYLLLLDRLFYLFRFNWLFS